MVVGSNIAIVTFVISTVEITEPVYPVASNIAIVTGAFMLLAALVVGGDDAD